MTQQLPLIPPDVTRGTWHAFSADHDRDERHRRQQQEARRPVPTLQQPPAPNYIDATWRELTPTPRAARPAPHVAIEAPTRALTTRN